MSLHNKDKGMIDHPESFLSVVEILEHRYSLGTEGSNEWIFQGLYLRWLLRPEGQVC